MSDPVISVENLSKSYRLGQIGTGTLRHDLNIWWARMRGKPSPISKIGRGDKALHYGETIWALQEVSFAVDQGEAIGIIGRNGAGKSTLLKILSEVTAPTSGEVKIKGRIASLLEVGTGFHPDLTGRENTYLNGAILGMKRQEIARKFDEIVDFADIAQFIDTPVKRYSSGMYVRLAFAVAAHLEPEILVIDEVLAVGDAQFQRKCLGKMSSVASEGRTVLFVSHNMLAVQSLCQRAIWLDEGRFKEEGPVEKIVTDYLQSGLADSAMNESIWPDNPSAPGNDTVRLRRITIKPEVGKAGDMISTETPFRIELEYRNLRPSVPLHPGLQFHNDQAILEFTTGAMDNPDPKMIEEPPAGIFLSVCHVPGNLLNSGFHQIDLFLVRRDFQSDMFRLKAAIGFEVVDNSERKAAWYEKVPGVVRPELPWDIKFMGQ